MKRLILMTLVIATLCLGIAAQADVFWGAGSSEESANSSTAHDPAIFKLDTATGTVSTTYTFPGWRTILDVTCAPNNILYATHSLASDPNASKTFYLAKVSALTGAILSDTAINTLSGTDLPAWNAMEYYDGKLYCVENCWRQVDSTHHTAWDKRGYIYVVTLDGSGDPVSAALGAYIGGYPAPDGALAFRSGTWYASDWRDDAPHASSWIRTSSNAATTNFSSDAGSLHTEPYGYFDGWDFEADGDLLGVTWMASYGMNIFQINLSTGLPTALYNIGAQLPAHIISFSGLSRSMAPLQVPSVYPTIQAAIDAAAPGDTIEVASGTYVEQLNIAKDVTIQGVGATTIVQSPNTLALSFTTSAVNKPVVFIHDTGNVILKNLCVDGAGKGNANVRFEGVAFYNAGGSILNCEIKNVRDTPFSGAQHGVGVYAYNADGGSRMITMSGSSLHDIQKSCAVFAGAGLTVDIDGNKFLGVGPTTVTAQNGLQVNPGATGTVTNNYASGFYYSGSGWGASAIINSGTNVTLTGNIATLSNFGIYMQIGATGTATAHGNSLTGNDWGLIQYDGSSNSQGNWWGATNGAGIYSGTGYGDFTYDYGTGLDVTLPLDKPAHDNSLYLVAPGDNVFVKPGATVTLDMNVANLTQPVSFCRSILNYDPAYFTAATAFDGGSDWNDPMYGSITNGIRIDSTATGGTTVADGTVAKVRLTAGMTEGYTGRVWFAQDVTGVPTKQTFLNATAGGKVWPAKVNSTSIVVDGTRPTITVGAPSVSTTSSGPVTYTVTYTDDWWMDTIDLDASDITLNRTGTATGTVSVSGTGDTRTVTISDIHGAGTLGISIAAGTACDKTGNTALASGPSAAFAVTFTNVGPQNVSITPDSGTLATGTPLTLSSVYRDPNSAFDIKNCWLTVNTTLSSLNGVVLFYDSPTNKVYLRNDANTSYGTGIRLGTVGAVLENSQCKIYVADTTVTRVGTDLTINWNIELKPVMAGAPLKAWMFVADTAFVKDGYDMMGTYFTPVAPQDISLSPSTGAQPIGTPVAFSSLYRDANGFADIKECYLIVNQTCSGLNGISLYYDRPTNKVYLRNDGNTSWGTGYAPGTAVVLENSQCKLDVAATTVSPSGTDLTVNWNVELKPSMTGLPLSAWMRVRDGAGMMDGYELVATYYTPAPPENLSLFPSAGWLLAGNDVTFETVYSDANGSADIKNCYLVVTRSWTGGTGVWLYYDQSTNKVYLGNGTSWGTGYAPGTAITLTNSQCSLDVANTSVVASGNELAIYWQVRMNVNVSGNASMLVRDYAGTNDGYEVMGSFF